MIRYIVIEIRNSNKEKLWSNYSNKRINFNRNWVVETRN